MNSAGTSIIRPQSGYLVDVDEIDGDKMWITAMYKVGDYKSCPSQACYIPKEALTLYDTVGTQCPSQPNMYC